MEHGKTSTKNCGARFNIAIVGQTGVGKSSLVNYLYGVDVARTGVGRPVTPTGFHPVDFEIEDFPVTLYDSWGLEVGNEDVWIRGLKDELVDRSIAQPAARWFHSVLYCINAASARVQDSDIKVVRTFMEQNYEVSVVLTKCDLIDEETERRMHDTIRESVNVEVISACSTRSRTRAGVSEPFGKDCMEEQVFFHFFCSLVRRLPLRCRCLMEKYVDVSLAGLRSRCDEMAGWMGLEEEEGRSTIDQQCRLIYTEVPEICHNEFEATIDLYNKFLRGLRFPKMWQNLPDRTFHSSKPNTELSWWEIPVIAVILPVLALFGAFKGRDVATESLQAVITQHEPAIRELISAEVKQIETVLCEARERAAGWLAPNREHRGGLGNLDSRLSGFSA